MNEPQAPVVASNELLAEKCDDLAKGLADKIMRYLGKQVCLDEEIAIGDIEALISNDLMVILTANPAVRGDRKAGVPCTGVVGDQNGLTKRNKTGG